MILFNKKQLAYAIIPHAIKAVIAIGIATSIISFVGERIEKINLTLNEKKVMTMALQERSETISNLRNTFTTIGESDKKMLDAFPNTENVLDFVSAIETIGNQNSMQQSLKFGVPETPFVETSAITIVPVEYTMSANGTIATLINYMRQFEQSSYFASIRSFTIVSSSAKGWEDSSSMTIRGTLYTKKSL